MVVPSANAMALLTSMSIWAPALASDPSSAESNSFLASAKLEVMVAASRSSSLTASGQVMSVTEFSWERAKPESERASSVRSGGLTFLRCLTPVSG